jgi:WD40 repeat protein
MKKLYLLFLILFSFSLYCMEALNDYPTPLAHDSSQADAADTKVFQELSDRFELSNIEVFQELSKKWHLSAEDMRQLLLVAPYIITQKGPLHTHTIVDDPCMSSMFAMSSMMIAAMLPRKRQRVEDEDVRSVQLAYNPHIPDEIALGYYSGDPDNTHVSFWNSKTGQVRREIHPEHWLNSISFNPQNPQEIAVSSSVCGVSIWNHITGAQQASLPKDKAMDPEIVVYNPHNGEELAIGYRDGYNKGNHRVEIWNTKTGTYSHQFFLPGYPNAIEFNPHEDGSVAVACHESNSVYIWKPGKLDAPTELKHTSDSDYKRVDAIAFHPHNPTQVATACDDHVYIWNYPSEKLHSLLKHGRAQKVAYNPHCNGQLVSIGQSESGNTARIWHKETGEMLHELPTSYAGDIDLAFNPLNPRELAISCRKQGVRLWDIEGVQQERTSFVMPFLKSMLKLFSSTDSSLILVFKKDNGCPYSSSYPDNWQECAEWEKGMPSWMPDWKERCCFRILINLPREVKNKLLSLIKFQ